MKIFFLLFLKIKLIFILSKKDRLSLIKKQLDERNYNGLNNDEIDLVKDTVNETIKYNHKFFKLHVKKDLKWIKKNKNNTFIDFLNETKILSNNIKIIINKFYKKKFIYNILHKIIKLNIKKLNLFFYKRFLNWKNKIKFNIKRLKKRLKKTIPKNFDIFKLYLGNNLDDIEFINLKNSKFEKIKKEIKQITLKIVDCRKKLKEFSIEIKDFFLYNVNNLKNNIKIKKEKKIIENFDKIFKKNMNYLGVLKNININIDELINFKKNVTNVANKYQILINNKMMSDKLKEVKIDKDIKFLDKIKKKEKIDYVPTNIKTIIEQNFIKLKYIFINIFIFIYII